MHGGSSVNLASTKVQSPRDNEVINFHQQPMNSARECASQGGETSVTELNSARQSHKIIQETDCGCSTKFESKNIFASPAQTTQNQTRVTSGNGMRSLPRLSASQAVNNFREIYSEKDGKYRHVSHADFHKSQEMIKKCRKEGRSYNGYPADY